ncbi:MAG: UdgX family uracil-DNA binding protein [Gammaproteobacteria bacterium]|nr:UdgX family uracil-DNA binding protein [Gammaproteobacteria bacterium]
MSPRSAAPGETAKTVSARDFLPPRRSLKAAREAAAACRGCPLWRNATQTVFGEGPRRARLMLIGEMPGDREDLAGKPFVGPAGRLLDEALRAAGIERDDAYVTNVVKHFKWEPRGKRRLHKKPGAAEVAACRPWLDVEIELVQPSAIVCLGATAARSLLGPRFLVSKQRGRPVASDLAPYVTATVHPSSLLRLPDSEDRREAMTRFVADLGTVGPALERG